MNRITRMLTMTGIGLFAGVTVGAGPAMAGTGAAPAQAKSAGSASAAQPGLVRLIDVYSSPQGCIYAGQLGQALGSWDAYSCDLTFGGYALQVSFDTWGNWNNWDNDDWDGPWGNRRNFNHRDGGNFNHHGGKFHHKKRHHRD